MDKLEIAGYISIAVIVISLFFIGTEITGKALSDTGVVNVTIISSASINFSTDLLDFGSGSVNTTGARLWSNGTVTGGTWAGTTGELILENVGNSNVSLTLRTDKSPDEFIGGDGSAEFKANVSDAPGGSGACTGTLTFASYADINTTAQTACDKFRYQTGSDNITIDFEIYVPNDALGFQTIQVTAEATAIA